jgi:hypothetical protein
MTTAELRDRVIRRDGFMCVASVFATAGPCYDRWGNILRDGRLSQEQLEMDYVRKGARGRHHELECDHVSLCAGHHRGAGPQGGKIWATSHRPILRNYLDDLYPIDER